MLRRTNIAYGRELGRAAGGAILFAFPLLMTMEMWWLGFYVNEARLLLFLLMGFVLLGGLSYFAGFEAEEAWLDTILDALSAYAVAVLVCALFLAVFGVVQPGMSPRELVGKIAITSIPAGIGALVARKQLQSSGGDSDKRRSSYFGEMFLMLAGAVFVAFNVAPTDEISLISALMSPPHVLALVAMSLIIQHALVYSVEFRGQEIWPSERRLMHVFTAYTLAGYGVSLAVSFYVLWTFGRLDGLSIVEVANLVAVLGFPAALGAATARLVV
jgi:putative integral membrane protein (TIGR02587 family)